jgi:hypothetical protein
VAPQSLPLRDPVRAALFESREPFLASCYLGLGAFVLAAAGVAAGPTLARLLGGVAAAALVVGLGRHTSAYGFLTAILPPLRVLRYPSKALVVTAFALALLAGMGVEAWRTGSLEARRRRSTVAGIAAAAAAAAAAFAAALFFHSRTLAPLVLEASSVDAAERLFAPFARGALGAGLAAAAIAVLVLASGAASRARSGSIAAGALALADLLATHLSLQPTMPAGLLSAAPPTLSAIDRSDDPTRLYAFEYGPRLLGRTYRRPERPDAFRAPPGGANPPAVAEALGLQAYLPSSASRRWGLDGSFGADVLGLYPRPLFNLNLWLRAREETDDFVRLLRRGGVRYVTAVHDEGLEALTPVARFPGLVREPIRVFRVLDPLPRAYAVSGSRTLDGLAAYKALSDPSFAERDEVILPEGPASPPVPGFRGSARILERRPDRLRLEADLSDGGYVVVLEGYEAGWHARVDGRTAAVLRANTAFRAVPVGPGRHEIALVYRPMSAALGVTVSAAAALAGLALALARRP